MKNKTILMPMMAPIHFELFKNIFNNEGYHFVLLTNTGQNIVEEGLKYVHNDTCYPALLVIGQIIDALKNGDFDPENTYCIMSQTGGGCRASNYLNLMNFALKKAGFEKVRAVSINLSKLENEYTIPINYKLIRKAGSALIYGDLLMLLHNQTRPYEINKGESKKLVDEWVIKLSEQFNNNKGYKKRDFNRNLKNICISFENIEKEKKELVKVGIVGEIYVKYSSLGNNDLEEFLYNEGCEIQVPGILGFMLYSIDTRIDDIKLYGGSKIKKLLVTLFRNYLINLETKMHKAIKNNTNFYVPNPFLHTKELTKGVISTGNKMGEGWLLTAEMLELIDEGFENIICTQPFGCLPNHIVGKGMIRRIVGLNENANIVPIDYDPGATKVNQENRIKLMLAIAKERLKEKQNKKD